jgi:hypothetical protein
VVVFRVFGLLIHQRRDDRAGGSGGFFPFACCYCLFYVKQLLCAFLSLIYCAL